MADLDELALAMRQTTKELSDYERVALASWRTEADGLAAPTRYITQSAGSDDPLPAQEEVGFSSAQATKIPLVAGNISPFVSVSALRQLRHGAPRDVAVRRAYRDVSAMCPRVLSR
jgi:hypothetical protein